MGSRPSFELARGQRHYFEVPSNRDSFTIDVDGVGVNLFDPSGTDRSDLTASEQGEITVACAGNPGMWSFATNQRSRHVRLVDLEPFIATGDPERYFVPASYPPPL